MEKVIVFTLDGEYYGLSVMSVKEVVKTVALIPVPGSNPFIEGVMNLRGKVIPIINLEKRFGLKESGIGYQHIVVVESNSITFGLLVTGVSEVLTVSSESIQPVPETLSQKIDKNLLKGVIVDSQSKVSEKADKPERLILYLNPDTIISESQTVSVSKITEEIKETNI